MSREFLKFETVKVADWKMCYKDTTTGEYWVPLNDVVGSLTRNANKAQVISKTCMQNDAIPTLIFVDEHYVSAQDFLDFLDIFQVECNLRQRDCDRVAELLAPLKPPSKKRKRAKSEEQEFEPTEIVSEEEEVEEEEEEDSSSEEQFQAPALDVGVHLNVLNTLAQVASTQLVQENQHMRRRVEEQMYNNLNIVEHLTPYYSHDVGEFVGVDEWLEMMNYDKRDFDLNMEVRKRIGLFAAKFYREKYGGLNPPRIYRIIDGTRMMVNKYTEHSAPYSLEPAIEKVLLKEN